MVPAAFVFLEVMPQTLNGKVNRQALPAPGTARPELESPFVASSTPTEEVLVKIWAEVLRLDQVGIYDNFLELGGDSLLASQVIARVIKTFQVEVPLRSLWGSPTVAEMAEIIVQGQVKAANQEAVQRMLSELESFPEASP